MVTRHSRQLALDPELVCAPMLAQMPAPLEAPYARYEREMPVGQPGRALVIQDKDTAVGWSVDAIAQQFRGLHYLTADGYRPH